MVDAATRDFIRRRAAFRCEYCLLLEAQSKLRHHIEHITAKQHGGPDTEDNLALSCHRCNLHKGSNLSGVDPLTAAVVLLFHPRKDACRAHFRWCGIEIQGITDRGRATVRLLGMNDARRLQLRSELMTSGLFRLPDV
jgi:hypothetical protein